MSRPWHLAVVLTLAAGAAWFVANRSETPEATRSVGNRSLAGDVYQHFVPNMVYAGHALRAGGRGLAWNPLHHCGQPFAAFNGLWYPLHWLPVVFGIDVGLRLLIGVSLLVGGLFAYLLGRELGARPVAALTGALAFEMGNAAAQVAAWTPLVLEPFMWFPAVFLCVERLLRAPSARWVVALGATSCMAILPAWPQLVVFLYQLAGLRVVWALAVERPPRLGRSLPAVVAGLALGPLLAGVQVLPGLEAARESVRSMGLGPNEIRMQDIFALSGFRNNLSVGLVYGQPFSVVPCLLAGLAVLRASGRRIAAFYATAGALAFVLSLGSQTVLFDLYFAMPGMRVFREPARFVWVTGFCLSVLTALGADALARAAERRPRGFRWLAPVLVLAVWLALEMAAHGRLRFFDQVAGVLAMSVVGLAVARVRWSAIAPAALGALFVASVVLSPPYTGHALLPSSESLFAHAALFERLRARTGSTARTYIVSDAPYVERFALMHKTASLFEVRTVTDYEPQTAHRFAEFLVMLRSGGPMRTVGPFIYAGQGWLPPAFNRNLLDLAAGRYLVVAKADDDVAAVLRPVPPRIDEEAAVRVYENASALPRALWVPRVEVVPDPEDRLHKLAVRWFDPWRVALVETLPASGFLGEDTPGDAPTPGQTTFAQDDPERVAIDVTADRRGFLLLADQHHAGWSATVNGAPAPILRANHAFRLVEVPAGTSRVEFRYAPRSLWLGALVSVAALLAAAATLYLSRPRRAETRASAGSTA